VRNLGQHESLAPMEGLTGRRFPWMFRLASFAPKRRNSGYARAGSSGRTTGVDLEIVVAFCHLRIGIDGSPGIGEVCDRSPRPRRNKWFVPYIQPSFLSVFPLLLQ
jgi:hypothetical protein